MSTGIAYLNEKQIVQFHPGKESSVPKICTDTVPGSVFMVNDPRQSVKSQKSLGMVKIFGNTMLLISDM